MWCSMTTGWMCSTTELVYALLRISAQELDKRTASEIRFDCEGPCFLAVANSGVSADQNVQTCWCDALIWGLWSLIAHGQCEQMCCEARSVSTLSFNWWWWRVEGPCWLLATNTSSRTAGGASCGSPKVFVCMRQKRNGRQKLLIAIPFCHITHRATGYY